MRLAALALASMVLVSACADVVIPTEEEAASAGQSAAAAADAFISVFEERAEAERAELMALLEDTSEPLFTIWIPGVDGIVSWCSSVSLAQSTGPPGQSPVAVAWLVNTPSSMSPCVIA